MATEEQIRWRILKGIAWLEEYYPEGIRKLILHIDDIDQSSSYHDVMHWICQPEYQDYWQDFMKVLQIPNEELVYDLGFEFVNPEDCLVLERIWKEELYAYNQRRSSTVSREMRDQLVK